MDKLSEIFINGSSVLDIRNEGLGEVPSSWQSMWHSSREWNFYLFMELAYGAKSFLVAFSHMLSFG